MGNKQLVTTKLVDLCELIVDCPHSTPEWTDSGYIVLRNQNIRNGSLDLSSPSFTDENGYKSRIKRAVPKAGDIVFTREAPMGEVCLIPEGLQCCLGQRQVLLRPKRGVSGEYLFWALQSPFVQHQISWNEGTGTTVSNIRIPVLKVFEIPRWFENERQIASHLSVIKNKINLNRQINQTLEQMAQTLFKSWFVDFDPVVDNALDAGFFEQGLEFSDELLHRAEARKTVRESCTFKSLPDVIRQLFPASFEECAEPTVGLGGWLPRGWRDGCVSDVARYRAGRINTTELALDNYISTENMLGDRKGVQPATTLPTVSSVPAYTSGTVLVSNIRPYFKKIWLAKGDGGHSNDVLGFEAKAPGTEGYLFNLMYQDTFFDFMMTTSKGSKMPRGDKKAILGWNLVVPPLSLMRFFSEKVNDFYISADSRHHENITLNQLRDTLLPKLISGELRLSDSNADVADEILA
ncbi:restriction endonuclease subunit S [Serratia fonticola]